MAAELTLGAEEELHLIDLQSGKLSARAPQILSRLPGASYSAELQRTTVETNTAVQTTLDGLRTDILQLRAGLVAAAAPEGVGIACVGTAPRSEFADFELTSSGRFARMQEQYRLLVDEQLICGTQVHVGVSDRDLAVEIAQRVARDLPVLLALSASSPYWNGQDTGYSSIRSIIWQRWPSAGATGEMGSGAEYDELLSDLIATGVIADAKMAYFEVRPSAHAPTLELRVCDACPIVDDAVLIAGLFRAAVRAAEMDIAAGRPAVLAAAPVHRAAMWQAARTGLSGDLLDDTAHPRPLPAAQVVRRLIGRLRPQLEELGDHAEVVDLAETLLARGNSADRQRAAFAETGSLDAVVRLVVEETHGPAGGPPPAVAALRGYRTRAGDEAVGPGARPRPAYERIARHYEGLAPERLALRMREGRAWVRARGMTVGNAAGSKHDFDVDLVPRVITAHEWTRIVAGVTQRARALESFLQDVYGEQRIVYDGAVTHATLERSPGWIESARMLPRGGVRAPIMAFDLVRNEFGDWRVLEDNLRNPVGVGYAIAIRELMDEVAPDVPRPEGLYSPADGYAMLRRSVLGHGSSGALLSSGPSSAEWFEHRAIAEGAGLALLGLDDVIVENGRVFARAQRVPVDALYLRLDVELPDAVDSAGRAIGREIMEVAASGGVALANAPGNGVGDDKAMYCDVPAVIAYYLGERPLLEQVPTYRTVDDIELLAVLERVGELVTKPVGGDGGAGVLVGPSVPAAAVAERRSAIAAAPADWVAQEVVPLSSHPTLVEVDARIGDLGAVLEPRRVDLRVFVFATEDSGFDVAPFALTRVAPAGSMVVSASQGGGAKDTWILRG
ncbi:carboxylate--amine ligase/circularly permuted type 2 ATP-grasp protein [Herbiconiux sp. CPCC 205763]|uniref:Putative glutamate--cysteine ligase 2 n=1 Tax=Herbiconiux aconitum TaxID=2970913 RepID=A0ABT2GLQ5_9MICO|nr:carboxylate--amine ligase/circularly permuted type 2 ATP-grasp protein [Herbiconiux aconitum]MCS5717157.1 carboxylate--amine ligase/circularly permuted type 2 ATP-grasp protein [Herbiconiux aconitum]